MGLGFAMLIAESEEGAYQPVAVVGSIREARELAGLDLKNRMRSLEDGGSPMCVYCYKVWGQDEHGGYGLVEEIEI